VGNKVYRSNEELRDENEFQRVPVNHLSYGNGVTCRTAENVMLHDLV